MSDRIVFNNGIIDIDIAKELSVYRVDSAIGKTYLPFVVNKMAGALPIFTFSNKGMYSEFIKKPWAYGDDVVYSLDRYDVFRTEEIDAIVRSSVGRCVLLDLKSVGIALSWGVSCSGVVVERPDARRFVVRNGNIYK